jgi:hypothetical protein
VKFGDIKGFLSGQSFARDVEELRDTALRYVKEETIDTVKALGTYAAFGCLGSFLIGLGGILCLIGALRGLAHVFHGTVSWIPYFVVVLVGIAFVGVTIRAIQSGPARRRLPKKST